MDNEFVVVGFYASTGQRYMDEIVAASANDAEDHALRTNDDLVIVASFVALGCVLDVNVERSYVVDVCGMEQCA